MSDTQFAHGKALELVEHVVRMTTAAGSGHPSTATALAHIIVDLMYKRMRYDPSNPWNPASDRLVLSLGHGVPIVYAAYADLGGAVGNDPDQPHTLGIEDLKGLRELDSVLDGHPNPAEGFPFFDAATGSLGQGVSVAAGLALAARLDGMDKRIYAIVGDGESREGQIWEAMDFAVDHKLSNVCVVFSCNGHGQAAAVSRQQSPDSIAAKARAFGWGVMQIDGHDPEQIDKALSAFERNGGPLAIVARTVKGWGVELMQGKNFHGKPVPPDQLERAIRDVNSARAHLGVQGVEIRSCRPETPPAASGCRAEAVTLPPFADALKRFGKSDALTKKSLATRMGYGVAMAVLGEAAERFACLDADVSNSTFAEIFAAAHPDRYFECKIAEQNMISVAAGMAATGKVPFASSFAKFIARAVDQIDMAAISGANVKIVGSHAGVSLAADGPSQMAVSDVAYFRSLTRVYARPGGRPLCTVFHPSDGISSYRLVELMANTHGLCYLRTHRPPAPFLYEFDESFELGGCKKLRTGGGLTLVSSGYMVHTALAAAERLAQDGVECTVYDAYTLPLNPEPILDAARSTGGRLLVVEDNYIGGVHSELAEAAAEAGDVRVVGLTPTRVPKSTKTADQEFGYVGVGTEHIVARALTLLAV